MVGQPRITPPSALQRSRDQAGVSPKECHLRQKSIRNRAEVILDVSQEMRT